MDTPKKTPSLFVFRTYRLFQNHPERFFRMPPWRLSKGSHWIPSCRWSIKNRGQVDLIKDIPHQVGETNTWIRKSLGRGLWSWTSELCMGSPVNSRKHMGSSRSNQKNLGSLGSKGGTKTYHIILGGLFHHDILVSWNLYHQSGCFAIAK